MRNELLELKIKKYMKNEPLKLKKEDIIAFPF
jgi:hypothetical protein